MEHFATETGEGTAESELTPRQESALAALLAHGTVARAAAACDLSVSTIWRFLQLKPFKTLYKAARAELVQGTIARLQSAGDIAVTALCEIAEDKESPASARIAAARAILAGSFRGLQLQEAATEAASHLHLCATCQDTFSCTDPTDAAFEIARCPTCKSA
jgi:DNA-binding MurR/RpiR family transcriptional regulator